MPLKYRFRVSVILFVLTYVFVLALIGGAVCSDGWSSGSIGSRGACSHHGGVSKIPGIISFVFSCIAVFYYNSYVDKNYRRFKNFVVNRDFPFHELESTEIKRPSFNIFEEPKIRAKSRKQFQCEVCKSIFSSGSYYSYTSKKSRGTKYCDNCTKSIPSLNAQAIEDRDLYNFQKSENDRTIETYYESNAVAKIE